MGTRSQLVVWIAQGFGLGRIPVAPGSWGTLLGLPWTAALLWMGNPWFFWAGAMLGVGFAVWICGEAEEILGRKDPGSVVLDEVVALPLAYSGWFIGGVGPAGGWPGLTSFEDASSWLFVGLGFAAFRVLDITKPWPIRATQHLRGGWGVVADDVAAALVLALVWVVVRASWGG